MGKDLVLVPSEVDKYDYERVGGAHDADQNLLIVGDSGDAPYSLGTIPEWSDSKRGTVKLYYIDPPCNTGQALDHYAAARPRIQAVPADEPKHRVSGSLDGNHR
ncbi:hypothetical protein [Williamsia herbipolensis]|uniref:hypothetical protein n=1 Tax=Williamsia herbipolensis TaxID=1603258 RepID=UPI000A9294FA|nr:hypothetical protein [Williamsia herbipolensis]